MLLYVFKIHTIHASINNPPNKYKSFCIFSHFHTFSNIFKIVWNSGETHTEHDAFWDSHILNNNFVLPLFKYLYFYFFNR